MKEYKFLSLLNQDEKQAIIKLIDNYPVGKQKSALTQIIHILQKKTKWISRDLLAEISDLLQIPLSHAESVISFYSMFFYEKKIGHFLISVCRTTGCWVCNSSSIISIIGDMLGIKVNETTKDGAFTLVEIECIGRCDAAPVLQINDEVIERANPESIKDIITKYQRIYNETINIDQG